MESVFVCLLARLVAWLVACLFACLFACVWAGMCVGGHVCGRACASAFNILRERAPKADNAAVNQTNNIFMIQTDDAHHHTFAIPPSRRYTVYTTVMGR